MHETMQRLFLKTGLSPTDLANAMDESPQNINNWSKRGISKSGATKAFEVFGIPLEWLLTGKGDITTTSEPHQTRKKRYIPIKGTAQMGDKGYWTELDNSDGYLEVSTTSSEIYAIRAIGESMYPAIRAGWYVVFDKNKSPMPGEYVHILLQDGRNMIKEFISNQNGILSVMSVNGMERMSFPIQEVVSLNAFIEIQPPSGLILEIPEVLDIDE